MMKANRLLMKANRSLKIRQLKAKLVQVKKLLEIEKQRGKVVNQVKKVWQDKKWWEEMSYQQLEHLKVTLLNLKAIVTKYFHLVIRVDEIAQRLFRSPGSSSSTDLGSSSSTGLSHENQQLVEAKAREQNARLMHAQDQVIVE
ncbi:uncharacterized protein LOC124943674 [Impatiens glandulifera]|uniref:uncharacterized protein LOC124943674 n=1 Tax=Impatiens glandulifera TaxID=253017 RepID=UPI001FB0C57F|nr:uncharacterized protein LOC124943674 [Impatiens glandulifera]